MNLLWSVKLVTHSFKNVCIWHNIVAEGNFCHILPVLREASKMCNRILFKYSVGLDEIHKTKEFGLKAKVWSLLISSLDNHPLRKKNEPAIKIFETN